MDRKVSNVLILVLVVFWLERRFIFCRKWIQQRWTLPAKQIQQVL